MKKISKVNQLVLRGLLDENKDLFINRLSTIMSFKGMDIIELLAEGLIVDCWITDEDEAIKALTALNRDRNWSFSNLTIEPYEGCKVKVKYTYHSTKYFATQSSAEKYSKGYSESGVTKKDEEHPFEGIYTSTSSDTFDSDKSWIEVEIL